MITHRAWVLLSTLCLLFFAFIILKSNIIRGSRGMFQILQKQVDVIRQFENINRDVLLSTLKKQRDDLSSRMVNLSKEFHKYQCQKEPNAISGSGGWCAKDASPTSMQHLTDKKLAGALIEIFSNQTVASFGEGPGMYKSIFDASGKVILYDGFDGAPFSEDSTKGAVKYVDLSVPLYGFKIYDWVISLEVAEHIPREYEQIYLDNIVNHASKGIILSWAVPGQGGHGHVNGRTIEYVLDQLTKRGFERDVVYSKNLRSMCTLPWLKNNVNLYRRQKSVSVSDLWA